ncbi:MAG: metallophosphoesterase, partial [Actinobacteria bacterium]|nr:metallophosphoesterase [Actinomycetota bacterium]
PGMRRTWTLALLLLLLGALPASGQVPPAQGLGPCERPLENVPPRAPRNVELTTVTDTEFVLTWLTCGSNGRPHPTDSKITYWPLADPLTKTRVTDPEPTAFHHMRVGGLTPGTLYAYRVSSSFGREALVDRLNPGVFKTLKPPPGRELFRLGIVADTHIGETTSGLATDDPFAFPPSYRSDQPYAELLAEVNVKGLNGEGVDYTILAADNSSHGELHQLARLKEILGGLAADYLIARGSHDRPNQYSPARSECPPDGDCFRQVFRPAAPVLPEPQHQPEAVDVGGYRLIALDSVNLSTGAGQIDAAQLSWLRARLEEAKALGLPSIITFHHPVAHYSTTVVIPPLVFGVNQMDADKFIDLIAKYDVRMVISAHTHRNWVAYDPRTGRMPFVEVGPSKEYPAGYSMLRVFEGGFIREWFPADCAFCDRWRETTRGEYFALYPLYTTGSLCDRNFVHRFDSPDVPKVPSIPLGIWPPFLCAV